MDHFLRIIKLDAGDGETKTLKMVIAERDLEAAPLIVKMTKKGAYVSDGVDTTYVDFGKSHQPAIFREAIIAALLELSELNADDPQRRVDYKEAPLPKDMM